MEYLNEFDGLPKELYDWGHETVSQIKSPEKRHKVATELRSHIDEMWNENQQLDETKRIKWILDNLGDSKLIGTQLEQEEKYEPYARKRYFIVAIALIIIGLIIITLCIVMLDTSTHATPNDNHVFSGWYTGRNLGMGIAAGIMLLIIGIRVLRIAIRTK